MINFPSGSTQAIHWNDITPRMGVAYDLFGNGKTAVKVNLGKYMEAFSATNTDLDLNPLIRTTTARRGRGPTRTRISCRTAISRTPRRTANAAPWRTRTSGANSITRTWDPNYVTGWGNRPYNWGLGVQVQQEILPACR